MPPALAAGDLGIDHSYARIDPARTLAAGGKFTFRYSAGVASRSSHPSHSLNAGKLITPAEFRALLAKGEDVVANSEWYTTRVTEGAGAGKADAQADAELWHACGYAKGASIYCSWDAAPVRSKWTAVDEYLHAYEETLGGPVSRRCLRRHPVPQVGAGPASHPLRLAPKRRLVEQRRAAVPAGTRTAAQRAALVKVAVTHTPAAIWQTGNYWFSKNADELMLLRPAIGSHRQALAAPVTKPPAPKPPVVVKPPARRPRRTTTTTGTARPRSSPRTGRAHGSPPMTASSCSAGSTPRPTAAPPAAPSEEHTMSTLADYGTAVIRTVVPGAVGAVAAWGTAHGIGIPDSAQEGVTAVLTFGFLSAYYAGVHALELRYPKLGALLGIPKRPVYTGLAPSLPPGGRHEVGAVADDVPDPAEVTGADYDPDAKAGLRA
jgi:hypothetical protein